jgi:octaprenyl-diphosphate synthase
MQVPETSPPAQTPLRLEEIFADIQNELAEVDRLIRDEVESDVDVVERSSRYIHESGGKRIRPALLLLASRVCGYRGHKARRYAAVMEMVHTATLVHDDIVDEATLRRGQTSVNSLLGNDVTVLLGDYLYIRSMRLAIELESLGVLRVICDVTLRMIEGMMLELTRGGAVDLTEEEHLDILQRKTAHLFSGCTRIGGIIAGAPVQHQHILADYGMNFGMAFQVVDDLLDFTSSEEVLGKPVLQDLKEGHITLPVIYALRAEPRAAPTIEAVIQRKSIDEVNRKEILEFVRRNGVLDSTREVANRYARRAKKALEPLSESVYKESLLALADYVIDRNR